MLSKQKNRTITFILFLVLGVFLQISYAQDETIRVSTDLVTVPATVLDRDGRYVTNLKKEDFQVFEDGVEQEIALFEPTEQSFTVLLLLDRSGSMGGPYREDLIIAANTFIKQLRHNDQVIAATFANNVDTLFQATKVKDLQKGIRIKNPMGDNTTMIYDAVEFALKKMKKVSGRKAIILFSDGAGGGYFSSAKENLRDAEEQEAMIYTVQFDTFVSVPKQYTNNKWFREGVETSNKYMRELPQKTGGRSFRIEDITDLEKAFGTIADELGRQYSLGYYPKTEGKKGERRQIKVKVRQPNLAVRARQSYVFVESKNKQR